MSTEIILSQLRPYQTLHDLWWGRLIDRTGVKGWLDCSRQLYYTMRSTAPLLRFAAAEAIRADADSNRHELNAFTEWATEHAEEEQEHHLWFLDDLSTVGISAEEINENIPHTAILELLGVQFSLISTTHPVGVLGYFLAMECSPSNPDRVKSLAENLGLPDEVLRTILYHTVVDQDHRREIIAISDKYSSHPTHRAAMTTGAIAALTGWSLYFHERQKIGAPNQAG